jgi:peptide/nickel transport system permease protein
MGFLLRRLFRSLFLVAGASVLSFAIIDLAPGDYFDAMRLNPRVSRETIAALRSEYGLNRPLPVQYLSWARSVLRGDWGFSLAYNTPAAPILWPRARHTLFLSATATLLAWLIAVPLGIWAAARPGTWIDLATRGTVSVLLAVPELVLALLFLLFAVRTGYLPAGGFVSLGSTGPLWVRSTDLARHLVLPTVCLAAGMLPLFLSHVRAAMIETLGSPFITAARAYGIPFRRILLRHALPVAANPLLSLFGLSIGLLLSSSLLVETIFGWPGLGQLLLEAILERDFFLVVDCVMLAALFLIVGNFIADLLLYLNDPRIRADS